LSSNATLEMNPIVTQQYGLADDDCQISGPRQPAGHMVR
jgi:hypothetical protein